MSMDDNDGLMIFGGLGGLKLPDISLKDEEKPRRNLTQETCPDRGSNLNPLHDKRACYHLLYSGGLDVSCIIHNLVSILTQLHVKLVELDNILFELRSLEFVSSKSLLRLTSCMNHFSNLAQDVLNLNLTVHLHRGGCMLGTRYACLLY